MTHLDNGAIVTDIDSTENDRLAHLGYTIRHIETWHRETDHTCIVWDAPEIAEADLPY